jgi:hypothetical protein
MEDVVKAPKPRHVKLSKREFISHAIHTLRTGDYLGIHVVYSGFNAAFRTYFHEDPREAVDQLVREGFLRLSLARGGAIIWLTSDIAERRPSPATETALNKILRSAEKEQE